MKSLFALAGMISLAFAGDSPNYFFDEGPNENQCQDDMECDGMRKCSMNGWCEGVSRVKD